MSCKVPPSEFVLSVSPCLCRSVLYLHLSLSVFSAIFCLLFSVPVSLCLSPSLSVCLSFLYYSLFFSVFVCLSILHTSLCLSACPFIILFLLCLSVRSSYSLSLGVLCILSVCPFSNLSCLFVSIYLSLSIRMSIFLLCFLSFSFSSPYFSRAPSLTIACLNPSPVMAQCWSLFVSLEFPHYF